MNLHYFISIHGHKQEIWEGKKQRDQFKMKCSCVLCCAGKQRYWFTDVPLRRKKIMPTYCIIKNNSKVAQNNNKICHTVTFQAYSNCIWIINILQYTPIYQIQYSPCLVSFSRRWLFKQEWCSHPRQSTQQSLTLEPFSHFIPMTMTQFQAYMCFASSLSVHTLQAVKKLGFVKVVQ